MAPAADRPGAFRRSGMHSAFLSVQKRTSSSGSPTTQASCELLVLPPLLSEYEPYDVAVRRATDSGPGARACWLTEGWTRLLAFHNRSAVTCPCTEHRIASAESQSLSCTPAAAARGFSWASMPVLNNAATPYRFHGKSQIPRAPLCWDLPQGHCQQHSWRPCPETVSSHHPLRGPTSNSTKHTGEC